MSTCGLVLLWAIWFGAGVQERIVLHDAYDTARECRSAGLELEKQFKDERDSKGRTLVSQCLPQGMKP
jgi:hypothetical protein